LALSLLLLWPVLQWMPLRDAVAAAAQLLLNYLSLFFVPAGVGVIAHPDLPADVIRSLAPKSTTAPVAMGIAERLGGIPALAAVFAVLTGMVGALSGKYLFDLLGIRDWAVRGFALGTAAHGIGAARALQVHADAGAYAGIALGLQVLIASLLLPLAARVLAWLSY
jgi:putative effector of murein hydrolase